METERYFLGCDELLDGNGDFSLGNHLALMRDLAEDADEVSRRE